MKDINLKKDNLIRQSVFIVLNDSGYIADSSESSGVCGSRTEAEYAINYLQVECGCDDDFTIVEAEMTLRLKTSAKGHEDVMARLMAEASRFNPLLT